MDFPHVSDTESMIDIYKQEKAEITDHIEITDLKLHLLHKEYQRTKNCAKKMLLIMGTLNIIWSNLLMDLLLNTIV